MPTFPEPQPTTDQKRPQILLTNVESNQVGAIGYDVETKTLAVRFKRGAGAIYHYPGVSPETHADFLAGRLGEDREPSIGTYFGKHIKPLPFTKFAPEPESEKASA